MGALATRRNVLFLALLLALLTSFLVYRFLQQQSRKDTIVKVPVVVANQEIEAREIIKPGQVGTRLVKSDEVRGDVCRDVNEVVGKAALVKIAADAAVAPQDVGEATTKLGLAYGIPPYMRAATVGIDDVSGVAGFLKPGDHVDVIGAFNVDGGQRAVARTVLQDVQLLALGTQVQQQRVKQNDGEANPQTRTTATLIVTPKDAEKLVLADTQDKLRLILRAPGDLVKVATAGANETQITGVAPKSAPAERTINVPSPAPHYVPPIWQAPDRPARWSNAAPLTPAPLVELAKPKIDILRGDKKETVEVEVEYRDKAPKTEKEVPGGGSTSNWLNNGL